MNSFLEDLNEKQKEAVEFGQGPLMVIAGAGSGKTRVLTTRIASLLHQGVAPYHILALTFTNKAAREMKERIEKMVNESVRDLWIGTFHSVFARLLRREAEHIGYESNFTIYDTSDSKSILRSILKRKNLKEKDYKLNTLLSRISNAKNLLISPQQYIADPEIQRYDSINQRPEIGNIYKAYVAECFQANGMDFDDILLKTYELLTQYLPALHKYQQLFEYVLIDEFQDTIFLQYQIAKKLAAVRQNICVVGDDAQSIYGFRGADVKNMLGFQKDYNDTKVIKLEQNYRSTKNILDAANAVIDRNIDQLKKNLWTLEKSGDFIQLIRAVDDKYEACLIMQSIIEQKMQKYLSYKDFCVLYRNNYQSRLIEEALRKSDIPYKIYGGISFYARKEVKDLLAYLRFIVNPQDMEALRRIINFPKRGIGSTTVDKITAAAIDSGHEVWQVLQNLPNYFKSVRAAGQIEEFVNAIKVAKLESEKNGAFAAAVAIAKSSGLLKHFREDDTVQGRSQYDNLNELLNSIRAFADSTDTEDTSLSSYIQQVTLLTSMDEKEVQDSVTLMTVHSAKGLEFPHVYVIGLEENVFPSYMSMNDREAIEEERRLFYVALTRAKKKLTLSCCSSRFQYGQQLNNEMSRFIEEVPSHLFTQNTAKKRSTQRKQEPRFTIKAKPSNTLPYIHRPSSNFRNSPIQNLSVGKRVEHRKFGFGTIQKVQSDRAVINFDKLGEKTLILAFAKLMIVD